MDRGGVKITDAAQHQFPIITRKLTSSTTSELNFLPYLNPGLKPTPHCSIWDQQKDQEQKQFIDPLGSWTDQTTSKIITRLPTSITYTLGYELDDITFVQFSDHGAYFAVGTVSGLVKLYCFGRNDQCNEFLGTLQILFQQYRTGLKTEDELKQIIAYNFDFFNQYHDDDRNGPFAWLLNQGIDTKHFTSIYTNTTTNKTKINDNNNMTNNNNNNNNSHFTFTNNNTLNNQHKPQVHNIIHHKSAITGIQFSRCLTYVLITDTSGEISMWGLTEGYFDAIRHISSLVITVQREYEQNSKNGIYPLFNQAKNNNNNKNDPEIQKLILFPYTDNNAPFFISNWTSYPAVVNTLSLSPCYGYFAVGHADLGISIYRTDLPQPVRMIPRDTLTNVRDQHGVISIRLSPTGDISWSPNGSYLAIAYDSGHVGIYEPFAMLYTGGPPTIPKPSQPLRIIRCEGRITCLQFSPCGLYLFTADTTLTMNMWSIAVDSNKPIERYWELDPTKLSVDITNLIIDPSQYIKLTLPIQKVPQFDEFHRLIEDVEQHPYQPLYIPQQLPLKKTYCFPTTPNGTIHSDIITTCAFSRIPLLTQAPQHTSIPLANQQPYILATGSLDGSVKLWFPHPREVFRQEYFRCCDLKGNLLQTIYFKTPLPVQHLSFTSRNLLLICTTDDDVHKLSTLSQATND